MSRLVRERGLALVALALALIGVVAPTRGSSPAQADVIVARHGVAANVVVARDAVRLVRIDARDVTPGMASRASEIVGRTVRVPLLRGDYVLRSAVGRPADSLVLRPGERAVPLSIDPAAAPPLGLLRAGAHVDVVAERDADQTGPARSRLVARDLTLLVAARASDAGLTVTLRAPLAVALELATSLAQAHRLRLFVRPAGAGSGG